MIVNGINNKDLFVVALDRKTNTATIFKPNQLSYSMGIDSDMRMEMSISKVMYGIDLNRIFYKFGTSIEDISEEDIVALLNEGGCFD